MRIDDLNIKSFNAGLDAAERAVAASWSWPDWADDGKDEQGVMLVGGAIAAIRSLKEKNND